MWSLFINSWKSQKKTQFENMCTPHWLMYPFLLILWITKFPISWSFYMLVYLICCSQYYEWTIFGSVEDDFRPGDHKLLPLIYITGQESSKIYKFKTQYALICCLHINSISEYYTVQYWQHHEITNLTKRFNVIRLSKMTHKFLT
jgi:hypothetical protein